MRRLTTDEGGFGVIELMIAMTVMVVGIMAIVAGFSSGITALNNASRVGTAGTLADRQMEAYRALSYGQIALSAAGTGSPYTPITGDTSSGDFDVTACSAGCVLGTASSEYTYCNTAPTTFPAPCTAIQPSVTGPDGRSYRVDTYIVWYCAIPPLQPPNGSSTVSIDSNVYTQASPGCLDSASPYTVNARPVKRITVVVRDAATTSKTYVSETSTFDQAT